jgi:hypothetical protein
MGAAWPGERRWSVALRRQSPDWWPAARRGTGETPRRNIRSPSGLVAAAMEFAKIWAASALRRGAAAESDFCHER